ncbi:MAG TPA: hypothetical protein VGH38_25850, partial [Bryobacteraceae bacterium]
SSSLLYKFYSRCKPRLRLEAKTNLSRTPAGNPIDPKSAAAKILGVRQKSCDANFPKIAYFASQKSDTPPQPAQAKEVKP